MAYDGTKLALLIEGPLTSTLPMRIWGYSDTAADATVYAAGYISDAGQHGVKVNDIVFYMKTDTNNLFVHTVTAIATTGNGGATLSSASVPDAH